MVRQGLGGCSSAGAVETTSYHRQQAMHVNRRCGVGSRVLHGTAQAKTVMFFVPLFTGLEDDVTKFPLPIS